MLCSVRFITSALIAAAVKCVLGFEEENLAGKLREKSSSSAAPLMKVLLSVRAPV